MSEQEAFVKAASDFKNDVSDMPSEVKNLPLNTNHAIATMALNFALKYHGMCMIPDGTMYQQYKMEGRNIKVIGLEDVFETAIKMEQHLIRGDNRIGKMVQEMALSILKDVMSDDDTDETAADANIENGVNNVG